MKKPSSKKFAASESALGYLYQVRYSLYRALIAAKHNEQGSILLEVLDDVSFSKDGQPIELIQTKHHITSNASLSNLSTDIWKTIRVWAEFINDNPGETIPDLMLVTTAVAKPTNAIFNLRISEDRDVEKALKALGDASLESSSIELKSAFEAFHSLSGNSKLRLFEKIYLLDSSPGVVELEKLIQAEITLPAASANSESFKHALEGWWFGRAVNQMMDDTHEPIETIDVKTKISALQQDLNMNSLPVTASDIQPSQNQIQEYENSNFVKQMEIVGVGPNRQRLAIVDFFQAYTQRSEWERSQLILSEDTQKYEKVLHDEWTRKFFAMIDSLSGNEGPAELISKGIEIFDWVDQDAQYSFRGVDDRFWTRGSYHILSEQLRVGWAPNYLDTLSNGPDV